jgi:hypothetical protein
MCPAVTSKSSYIRHHCIVYTRIVLTLLSYDFFFYNISVLRARAQSFEFVKSRQPECIRCDNPRG